MKPAAPALWPAPRAVAWLAAVAVALGLGAFWEPFVALAFVLAVAGVAACAVDLAAGPRAREIDLVRKAPERCALLVPGTIVYELTNRCGLGLRVELRESPVALVELAALEPFAVGARVRTELVREFTATDRGDTSFGTVYLRVRNRAGFLERRFSIDLSHALRINPDLSAVASRGSLAQQIRWREAGLRRLRRRGGGSEFAGLREYGPGDAYRDIDWKSSAHRGKLMVVEREVERSQQIVIALDCGRTMWPRIGAQRKFDYAVTAALSLATVAQTADDRVALQAFAAAPVASVPPGRGLAHARTLADALYTLQPRLEEPDYERAVTDMRRRYPRRSLVVVLTGMLDPLVSQTLIDALATLAPRHLVMCVLVEDASLAAAAAQPPRTAGDAYRSALAMRALASRARGIAVLRERGAIVVDVPAPELTVAAMDAYLAVKARGAL